MKITKEETTRYVLELTETEAQYVRDAVCWMPSKKEKDLGYGALWTQEFYETLIDVIGE